jgi:hypothetical protein
MTIRLQSHREIRTLALLFFAVCLNTGSSNGETGDDSNSMAAGDTCSHVPEILNRIAPPRTV